MATIDDIKAGLGRGCSDAEQALAQIAAIIEKIDSAVAVLHDTAAGTSQPAVHHCIGRLAAAKARFLEGADALRAAIADARRYSSVI